MSERRLLGSVDPKGVWDPGCLRRGPESVGHGVVGSVEDPLAFLPDDLCQTEMDVGRRMEADPGVPVLGVVVLKESLAERAGRGDVGETLGEGGRVLERLERGL